MLISTKGRYALRAVVDLAEHGEDGRVKLKDIAERQDISEKYLESILKALVKEKVIEGVRGKGGGYRLNKRPDELNVLYILELADGEISCVEGLDGDHSDLNQLSQYRMLDMWRELDALIKDYLGKKTIADLMHREDPADYYVI